MSEGEVRATLGTGGQGDAAPALLADPHHTRADIRLVGRAVRKRWGVPDEARETLPRVMLDIVKRDSVTVLTKDGQPVEVSNDRERIAAAKVLVQMEQQNQADDHVAAKNERLDEGKPTENVQSTVYVCEPPRVIGEGGG